MTEERKALISKIKIENDQTAIIEYSENTDMNASSVTFTGKEKVTEEFSKKFQENLEGFIGAFPVFAKECGKLKMNSIKFKYDNTGNLSNALYSVKYYFSPKAKNAVVNINTPNLPIYKEEFDEKTFCISGKYINLLQDILELAQKYLNGDTRTKQMKLTVV